MRYKIVFLFLFVSYLNLSAQENIREKLLIPDILEFKTLKCDFHMHTIYSDGEVLPYVRVKEAWADGLDAISITDHIEWWLYDEGERASRNKPFEDAISTANNKGVTLIRAIELTKPMPPGHLNLLFLKDVDKIDRKDYKAALIEAKKQGAFVFWNHPGWKAQAPDGIKWYTEHTEIFEKGWMQGIEVVNWNEYYPEAIDWCFEKDLTLVGNSDVHMPMATYLKEQNLVRRPITLVFAKSKREEDIHKALLEKRTALWFKDILIGKKEFLDEIFKNSINVESIIEIKEGKYFVQIYNNSSVPFVLENETIGLIELPVGKTKGFYIESIVKPEKLNLKVNNLKTGGKSVLETVIYF